MHCSPAGFRFLSTARLQEISCTLLTRLPSPPATPALITYPTGKISFPFEAPLDSRPSCQPTQSLKALLFSPAAIRPSPAANLILCLCSGSRDILWNTKIVHFGPTKKGSSFSEILVNQILFASTTLWCVKYIYIYIFLVIYPVVFSFCNRSLSALTTFFLDVKVP